MGSDNRGQTVPRKIEASQDSDRLASRCFAVPAREGGGGRVIIRRDGRPYMCWQQCTPPPLLPLHTNTRTRTRTRTLSPAGTPSPFYPQGDYACGDRTSKIAMALLRHTGKNDQHPVQATIDLGKGVSSFKCSHDQSIDLAKVRSVKQARDTARATQPSPAQPSPR